MRMTNSGPGAPRMVVNSTGERAAHDADMARKARWERWLEKNRAAIEDNNRRLEEQGLWSDGLRLF